MIDEFVKVLVERLEEEKYTREEKFQYDTRTQENMCSYNKGLNVAIRKATKLAEESNNGWIPFEQREMTEEELSCIGEEFGYILDCKLPDEDEEILVTYFNGTVGEDIFLRDGEGCYLESGCDFVTEAIAWMPKPVPYKPKESEKK